MKRASSGLGGPRIITPGLRGGAPQSLGVHPGSSTVPSGTFRQIPLCYAVLAQWVVGLMRATRTRAVRGSAFAQSSSGAHLIEAARACRVDRGGEGRSRAIAACLWVAFASDRLVATADGACAIARRQWPPGHCARTEASLDGFVVLSHHRRSEAHRGAIGAAGQPSQASDETLANRPRRKSRSAGWDASSSAIL